MWPCHGVEHLLSGLLRVLLSLVQHRVHGGIAVLPGDGVRHLDQLGERSFADQTVPVGVRVHEHLNEAVVQLAMCIALPACLLLPTGH